MRYTWYFFTDSVTPEEIQNLATPQQHMESFLRTFSDLHVANLEGVSVPSDYLEYSIKAMKHLKESGRTNVLYLLARSLATPRRDGTDSKFPTTRMPMGLLEHLVCVFDAEFLQNVSVVII